MTAAYRTRFAPSPTGQMHFGHARTALVTWLRARQQSGSILMRIEDIDRPRVVPGSADAIMRDHEWLGLDWDEGPVFQSEREDAYEAALRRLDRVGRLYPCTCSRKEIAEIASAPHDEEGRRYPGTCRSGVTHPDRAAALRFVFDDPAPGFDDLVLGPQPEAMVGGDFVLRRADGLWAYQLAVVVDDAEQGITEVIRGADLRTSTPRQLSLYRALGHRPPRFAHVGLVVDPSGMRLSKRHGSTAIGALREAGRSAEEVIGLLAHSLKLASTPAPVRPEDLISSFALQRIPGAPFIWAAKG